jgi:aspartate/methionine/tyrosine aminotransferase
MTDGSTGLNAGAAATTPRVSMRVRGMVFPPFDVLNQKAAALRRTGRHVITLGQAVPGFGPPAAAIEAANRALADPATHRYVADAGLLTLREALCEVFEREHKIRAHPDELIVTAGGNQAFMVVAATLLDPGDEVILASPYFVNHEMAIRAAGAIPVEAGLREQTAFRASWADIVGHITGKTRAVVLCTPSNPTGAIVAAPELAQIVHELSARGIFLICDETYLHFVYGGAHASAAAVDGWRQNVVVIGTFSKSFGMTGWRSGYLLADQRICSEAIKIQDAMIICAPVISQIAAEAAVRSDWNYAHTFHDDLRARRATLERGVAAIPRLHSSSSGGGLFSFVSVQDCRDSVALADQILERVHVVTMPGATFGAAGEGFLRLSYGAASQEELAEACKRLRVFFGG